MTADGRSAPDPVPVAALPVAGGGRGRVLVAGAPHPAKAALVRQFLAMAAPGTSRLIVKVVE